MNATVTTAPWLGTRKDAWAHEQFPETTLNDRQIRSLFNIREGNRMVQNLSATARPSIMAITDEITEVHVEFGHNWLNRQHIVFWLDKDGNMLSSVEEKYEGPQGVHPPGAPYRKWAVAYLRTPDMRAFDKAEEVEYERMYCISDQGAVDQVRKHIRDNWVDSDRG
jgi:hypothetical protein